MPQPPSHQTISYLGRRFSEAGIRLQKRRGQNFLIDLNLLQLVAERAQLGPSDVVLEVGTGTGALTALIAARSAHVISVEIDPRLHQLASEELVDVPNVTLLCMDALESKHRLDPRVIEAVSEQLGQGTDRQVKLVANLPYGVATPVIANLLDSPIVPRSMTVTLQKELADRLVARPCSRDYGAFSVWVQSQCRVEHVRTLSPSVFWPRPQVTSAIVHIDLDDARRAEIANRSGFHEFLRGIFVHRRKNLRRSLESAMQGRLELAAIDRVLAEQGLESTRAEELSSDHLLGLWNVIERAGRVN